MSLPKTILHQILACSPVLCLQFLIGTLVGWMMPTLAKLTNRDPELFVADADQLSWFASIHEVGRLFGPFVSPLLIDNLGRKYTLVVIAIIYLIVWSSVIFARNIYALCASRVLFGLGNAINDIVSGIYTTENCSPKFRGVVGSIVLLVFYVAVFIECIIATYLSVRTTAIVNTIIAGCVLVNVLCCSIETPSFLLMKGKREKAEKNLLCLSGGDDKRVDDELRRIEHSIADERLKKQSLPELLSNKANLKRIIIVISINILSLAAGGSAFGNFASLIFQPSGTFTTDEFIVLYDAVPLISVAVAPFIIERINRRSLVIRGFAGITFFNFCSFLLVYSRSRGYAIAGYPWLIFGSIASFSVCSALIAPALFALKAELLPLSIRAIGNSMAVIGFCISSFTVIKSFLPISQRFGMETNFFVYTATSLFTTIFFYFCLPETRGKTLGELQNVQKKKKSERVTANEDSDVTDA